MGAAVEEMWRADERDPPWQAVATALVLRVFAGGFLIFAVLGAEIAFEALGVGLGAD